MADSDRYILDILLKFSVGAPKRGTNDTKKLPSPGMFGCERDAVRLILLLYSYLEMGPLPALLGLQSRFGDKPVNFQVLCPQHGTAVLKGSGYPPRTGTLHV